jgi:hypothetical protein
MNIDISHLEFIDQNLRHILTEAEMDTGLEFTITSLFRINDDGVHGQLPLRGTDLRMRSLMVGKVLEEQINDQWFYDPLRPDKMCAYLHGSGANLHLHLQVHPNTLRK